MRVVTSCIFIAELAEDAETYQRIVAEMYNRYETPYEVSPVESGGPKVAGGYVFYNGFDYASTEMLEALKAEMWQGACVLWWDRDNEEGPRIFIGDSSSDIRNVRERAEYALRRVKEYLQTNAKLKIKELIALLEGDVGEIADQLEETEEK
jgi:hypothetical protein